MHAILDDVSPATGRLTELGRQVAAPGARRTHERVLLLAAMQRWPLVSHAGFAAWAGKHLDAEERWLVLDPLMPLVPGRSLFASFTRTATQTAMVIDETLPESVAQFVAGRNVGIVDDVAFSGGTIMHVSKRIADAGGQVTHVAVGISTDEARRRVLTAMPQVRWSQLVPGNLSAIHLRDGCCCLPFAGRRAFDKGPIATPNGVVEARLLVSALRGSLWELLNADRGFLQTAQWAGRDLAARFDSVLGRPATVSDIPLLGPNVAVPLRPRQDATADTRLRDLLA